MYVIIGDKRYNFHKLELDIQEYKIENTFAKFDKFTLCQLLTYKKYIPLANHVKSKYRWLLDKPAGKALLEMKKSGDVFYKQFLNNYGDMLFTRFLVKGHDKQLQQNGVYNIIVDNELVFSGVSARSFKERFNQHIGNISAKGCFKDGTTTHCHVNARLTQRLEQSQVLFYICPLEDKNEMIFLKNAIVKRFEPSWNLRIGKTGQLY